MLINYVASLIETKFINDDTIIMYLEFPEAPKPGQFVMISSADESSDPFLPRPISVFDWEDGILQLLIKVVGRGTRLLSKLHRGSKIRVVGHIGNSFPDVENRLMLVGGGIGIAPLHYTAKHSKSKEKTFILGFRTEAEVILEDYFRKLGRVIVTTDDGSYGYEGNPVSCLEDIMVSLKEPDMILTCGPEIMMKRIHDVVRERAISTFHSLEARMGCGIGACLGCKVNLPGGSFHVCIDGPIFESSSIFEGKK